ncbi:phosphatidate cytidylyltransferase [Pelobium manganitolerans]|uniref:Phosphatidate cytidylyltransferase n=1 Tax=Pelobium manganitolerans TaxID=1842495 RepID=A0A419S7K5_9SPHI|nr:phosphatidate cytidylyltransferase [Pelobium manganitolerans]RKD17315.1 phosphatidate cytidylyltransferase [Pelobium manganitolerans]
MKRFTLPLVMLLLMSLSSCSAIEGIFKAGYYVGIFVVVFVLFVIGFIWAKVRK